MSDVVNVLTIFIFLSDNGALLLCMGGTAGMVAGTAGGTKTVK